MKNLVIFFLFFCVHLSGGYDPAHASVHNSAGLNFAVRNFEKSPGAENATANHAYILIRNYGLSEDNAYPITAEDDNEDEDIIRKHISLVKCFLAFSHAFILSERISITTPLPLCKHLAYSGSCKYITQRVLRI